MTIADAVFAAVDRLTAAGCDSPRLDAEVLMAESLRLTRTQLYAHCHRVLSTVQEDAFETSVDRRAAREPLAYIVGHKEFYGLDFAVDRRVLIPRPETEHLVEAAIAEVRRLAANASARIADVGTGSGCVAISLAVALPAAQIVAADQSADALAVAAANVRRHRVEDRVRLIQSDLLADIASEEARIDLIVANLPYISHDEWPALAPEISRFEPKAALDGGADGLDAIRRLLAEVAASARPPRALLLEIGSPQGDLAVSLARATFPCAAAMLLKDYAGLDRILVIRL